MTAVFVHGVPDTHRVWDGVCRALGGEQCATELVTLSLPGFGAPVPDGFSATKEEYVDWVVAHLDAMGEPVDLVGHDWGSIIVQRAVSIRPDLVRTWACGGGPIDREYVWHDMAQAWQTPEVGEQIIDATTPEALAAFLATELGAETAHDVAQHFDDEMRSCILRLYRSAVDVGEEWHDDVDAIDRPGLVLWGSGDPYVEPRFAERLAARTGAGCVVFDDAAHWWPVTRADEVARELVRLWVG
jgi:pimeloyl-ACP methyl ester carboxylesterase